MAGFLSLVSRHAARLTIRAVTFDVGGTLIEVWPSVGHVYAEVAAWHGVKGLSAELSDRRFAAAWRATRQFSHSITPSRSWGCRPRPSFMWETIGQWTCVAHRRLVCPPCC
jgi:FMN phosphatase YigB (HAD superfamily)